MKPTVTIDIQKGLRVLEQYQRLTGKDGPDIVNSKGLDFSFRALKETPKASREQIQQLEAKPWWPRFIRKRMREKGLTGGKRKTNVKFGATGSFAAEYSKKIIGSRLRAVAFVKSGWLPAIKHLYSIVRDKSFARGSIGGARIVGQPKGDVRPARSGNNPTAIMTNSAAGVDRVGVEAAQRAMDQVAADTAEYIARKLEGRARDVAR